MSDNQCILIEQVKQGNEQAFEQLYREFYKLAYYFAYKICHNEADAKDAVQDTFIEIHRSISSLKENAYFKAWMYKIVHSKCKKIFRKNKYSTTDFEDDPIIGNIREERMEFTPDYATRFHSDQEVLQACIDQLPLSQREIIILFYLEQMSIKEIADILTIPVGTVKSRLAYGRNCLKKALEAYQSKNNEPISFHTLDALVVAFLTKEIANFNGPIPLFTAHKAWKLSDKTYKRSVMALSGAVILCLSFLMVGNHSNQDVNMSNVEDEVKNPFRPTILRNESITNAQDAYFTLIAWACCEEMINEKPMAEILQVQPLYNELKEHGGAYYEELVKKNWADAYEKRLLDK